LAGSYLPFSLTADYAMMDIAAETTLGSSTRASRGFGRRSIASSKLSLGQNDGKKKQQQHLFG
jgi:hypothetical protein